MNPLLLALLISSGTATTDMASSQTNAATGRTVAASSTGTAAPMPPRVSAVPVSEGCLHHLRLETNATVEIDFGGDLASMPPMILARTGEVTLPRTPGRVVAWSVEDFRTYHVYAEGVFTVPACISAPERPVQLIDPPAPLVRRRLPAAVFHQWSLRLGGVR